MSNIEFESDVQNGSRLSNTSSKGKSNVGMANWLVRHGIISSDSTAKGILVAFIAINFIATGLILYFYVLH